jgi:hypothetical protein
MMEWDSTADDDESSEDEDKRKAKGKDKDEGKDSAGEPTREEERGEASEPDAPTGGEENSGMSTILDGGLGTGVQPDAGDQ